MRRRKIISHYTVTVVLDGEKVHEVLSKGERLDGLLAEALAPFDEDLQVDPYPNETFIWEPNELPFGPLGTDKREGLYVTDETRAANTWQAVYDELVEEYGAGMVQFDPEARKIVVLTSYNPQSRWDWYAIGGRWKDYFRDAETGKGQDWVLVKNLDTDAMIADTLSGALARYDRIRGIAGDREFVSWKWHVDKVDKGEWNIDEARKAYHAQESVKEVHRVGRQRNDSELIFADLDDYMVPREEYEQRKRNAAVPTYALLGKDGVWSEPGRMGWFGMSTETEATTAEFQAVYMEYISGLDPADVLVCVDCHI